MVAQTLLHLQLGGVCTLEMLSYHGNVKCKRISKSSTKAKYRAISSTCFQIVWLQRLLSEVGFPRGHLTPFHADNISVIRITTNLVLHERTKHIEVSLYLRSLWWSYYDSSACYEGYSNCSHFYQVIDKESTIWHQFLVDKLLPAGFLASISSCH